MALAKGIYKFFEKVSKKKKLKRSVKDLGKSEKDEGR